MKSSNWLQRSTLVLFLLLICAEQVVGSTESIGPAGINSANLPYTGDGISIGQVEPERPGKPGFDDGSNSNFFTNPEEVFLLNGDPNATPNAQDEIFNIDPPDPPDPHATHVAGVMISGDNFAPGVAKDASLYASGSKFRLENPVLDTDELTAQFIATRDNGDVRAINMSYIVPFDPNGVPDGNSNFTQFVDWSASEHDVLYVVAGREAPILPASTGQPQDNFNGMTVAFSRKLGGVFREVDPDNDFTPAADVVGARTTIDILAPGRDVDVVDLGGGTPDVRSGTSYAAPHVVGTVALLQEFAEIQIGAAAPKWGPNARRHEVMKAVLMNSADKLEDDGTFAPVGSLLGMERTVLDQNGNNWLQSEANDDSVLTGSGDIPLDDQMSAGHLNAKRALQQFLPGEFDSDGADVSSIGWDYGMTSGQGDTNDYQFSEQFQAGSYISITLAWDRVVEFDTDGGTVGVFDAGDTFQAYTETDPYADDVISDLDLILHGPVFIEAQSISLEGTLEHIFFEIPVTGQYRFEVEQFDADAGPQSYGVAWWYGLAPEIVIPIAGDFDGNGMVDAADLAQWEGDYGINAESDADGDGDSDGADFLAWQKTSVRGLRWPPTRRLCLNRPRAFC